MPVFTPKSALSSSNAAHTSQRLECARFQHAPPKPCRTALFALRLLAFDQNSAQVAVGISVHSALRQSRFSSRFARRGLYLGPGLLGLGPAATTGSVHMGCSHQRPGFLWTQGIGVGRSAYAWHAVLGPSVASTAEKLIMDSATRRRVCWRQNGVAEGSTTTPRPPC